MIKPKRSAKISQHVVNIIYPITMLELFALTICLPLILGLYFLKINFVTIILLWLLLSVVGPMVTAIIHTLQYYIENQEPDLFKQAWQFVLTNWRESFRIWLPSWLLILPTMFYAQINITGGPKILYILIPALIVVDLILAILTINALLIAGLFKFKYTDYWRLAVGGLAQYPLMIFADLVLLVIALAIGIWFNPLVDILLISCLLVPCYYLNQPIINWVKTEFTK